MSIHAELLLFGAIPVVWWTGGDGFTWSILSMKTKEGFAHSFPFTSVADHHFPLPVFPFYLSITRLQSHSLSRRVALPYNSHQPHKSFFTRALFCSTIFLSFRSFWKRTIKRNTCYFRWSGESRDAGEEILTIAVLRPLMVTASGGKSSWFLIFTVFLFSLFTLVWVSTVLLIDTFISLFFLT